MLSLFSLISAGVAANILGVWFLNWVSWSSYTLFLTCVIMHFFFFKLLHACISIYCLKNEIQKHSYILIDSSFVHASTYVFLLVVLVNLQNMSCTINVKVFAFIFIFILHPQSSKLLSFYEVYFVHTFTFHLIFGVAWSSM